MGINHLYSFLYPLKNKTDRSANNQNKMIKCKRKSNKIIHILYNISASIYQIYNETSPEISMFIIMLADVN